jgi:hypothetical protein
MGGAQGIPSASPLLLNVQVPETRVHAKPAGARDRPQVMPGLFSSSGAAVPGETDVPNRGLSLLKVS